MHGMYKTRGKRQTESVAVFQPPLLQFSSDFEDQQTVERVKQNIGQMKNEWIEAGQIERQSIRPLQEWPPGLSENIRQRGKIGRARN